MHPAFLPILGVLGFVGGLVSGLVGVGGAIVMIPLLFYVPPLAGVGSLDIKLVAGATMAQVLAASLAGAWVHGRAALVHRPLAVPGGTAMALGSLAGAIGSRWVSGRVLLVVFGAMSTVALPLMFVSPASAWEGTRVQDVRVSRVGAVTYPGVIGLLAGLVGAGGAFLLVPVLTGLLRVPMRLAIGTSLAITVASAVTGFLGKAVTGQVPPGPSAVVVLGAVLGAPLGARLSGRAPVGVLRGVLAGLIALATLRVWADVFTP